MNNYELCIKKYIVNSLAANLFIFVICIIFFLTRSVIGIWPAVLFSIFFVISLFCVFKLYTLGGKYRFYYDEKIILVESAAKFLGESFQLNVAVIEGAEYLYRLSTDGTWNNSPSFLKFYSLKGDYMIKIINNDLDSLLLDFLSANPNINRQSRLITFQEEFSFYKGFLS